MMNQSTQTMKKLTKIKLVNWHYFNNETILVNGSFLISGENASGKSTLLDAIQLVLTTNTRRFNPAANEKSKRDLKGYVRCKTGEEGSAYYRSGSVISYIALEFYEESKNKSFVIGVKLDSPDLDSDIRKKWFCEEGIIESLSFTIGNKPALDEQFKNNGRKVSFINSQKEAKARFKRRMGNLDDTFFELIPKSLAFKPMDNVKSFINKFILPQKEIDVDNLRENIRALHEMQLTIEEVKRQINQLEDIHGKYAEIMDIDKEILIIDILIKIAELEAKRNELSKITSKIGQCETELSAKTVSLKEKQNRYEDTRKQLDEINIAIRTSEYSRMIETLKIQLEQLDKERKQLEEKAEKLKLHIGFTVDAVKHLHDRPQELTEERIRSLYKDGISDYEKSIIFNLLKNTVEGANNSLRDEQADIRNELKSIDERLSCLSREIALLKKNKLTYPWYATELQSEIEKEFANRRIESSVRIFADLIELSDTDWQNAVEGYLNTQRFNIIVEPRYYDIAASVYDRVKNRIHSASLVNTQALNLDADAVPESLAAVVKSENRYARAYMIYLMGRVTRCERVDELKQYPAAITKGCMLYKSKALRKIDGKIYEVPYIGKYALKRQLELKEEEYEKLKKEKSLLSEKRKTLDKILAYIDKCNFEIISENISAPDSLVQIKNDILQVNAELKETKKNPNIIELEIKKDAYEREIININTNIEALRNTIYELRRDIDNGNDDIQKINESVLWIEKEVAELKSKDEDAGVVAEQKFVENKRKKSAGKIYENYQPRKTTLQNKRTNAHDALASMQSKYKNGDFGVGEDVILAYNEELDKLSKHDLITCEEKLSKAKEECELEFRESFLAKMRENIEQADDIFNELNKALKLVAYGNDRYKFIMSANKMKQGLYDMITSDVNLGGMTLFSSVFEEKYREEMDDLFLKLTESDVNGENVIKEYIDYRSYLDYDIEIISKEHKPQLFSKSYGEKSGGETQTPYYVAIAASFYQIYSMGESIRIIMLDEAFDKMDDDRIAGMMQFFKTQNFQIILATPPSKMEVIGEYVDTVLMTYRDGYSSIVEEFII